MFKRFKTRYYNLTLVSRDSSLGNPSILLGFNGELKIKIKGEVSREIIMKMLHDSKDEYVQETLKKYPYLLAWNEIDSL